MHDKPVSFDARHMVEATRAACMSQKLDMGVQNSECKEMCEFDASGRDMSRKPRHGL